MFGPTLFPGHIAVELRSPQTPKVQPKLESSRTSQESQPNVRMETMALVPICPNLWPLPCHFSVQTFELWKKPLDWMVLRMVFFKNQTSPRDSAHTTAAGEHPWERPELLPWKHAEVQLQVADHVQWPSGSISNDYMGCHHWYILEELHECEVHYLQIYSPGRSQRRTRCALQVF